MQPFSDTHTKCAEHRSNVLCCAIGSILLEKRGYFNCFMKIFPGPRPDVTSPTGRSLFRGPQSHRSAPPVPRGGRPGIPRPDKRPQSILPLPHPPVHLLCARSAAEKRRQRFSRKPWANSGQRGPIPFDESSFTISARIPAPAF